MIWDNSYENLDDNYFAELNTRSSWELLLTILEVNFRANAV